MPPSEAQRRAHRAYTKRLKAGGGATVTVRLSAAAKAALDRLAQVHGSQSAAVEHLLTKP